MFVCNHPCLSIANGCVKDKRMCCYSCTDEDCTNRCIYPKCTHKLEVKTHEMVRVDNLMYRGCEPHWKCKHCVVCIPFHCFTKEQCETQECKGGKANGTVSD